MTRGKTENIKLSLPVSESRDHIQGSITAPVTLVEYGDYECPYCAQAYLITKEIQERLGDKMCFVFRNFPLTKIRPHAYETALAAEAAAAQVNSGICMTIYSKMVRLLLMIALDGLLLVWD
ncbi:MAG TPA: thioredoxin domain-containing protein [Nitrososphaeraceae archaeon]|nr:thioredoxin domain-containing protein [Nitrososphaeraceae archaeon]